MLRVRLGWALLAIACVWAACLYGTTRSALYIEDEMDRDPNPELADPASFALQAPPPIAATPLRTAAPTAAQPLNAAAPTAGQTPQPTQPPTSQATLFPRMELPVTVRSLVHLPASAAAAAWTNFSTGEVATPR
jgi:hypothetical protein